MGSKKKQIAVLGAVALILMFTGIFYAREIALKSSEDQKKADATEILDLYKEKIILQLTYHLNYAKEIAQKIEMDPFDITRFKKITGGLGKDKGIVYAMLIQGEQVICSIPKEYNDMTDKHLVDFPYTFMIPTVINQMVIEEVADIKGASNREILFLYPILKELRYQGQVAVCLDKEIVLRELKLDYLSKSGYEYELWQVASQNGDKQMIATSDKSFDFSQGERVQFELPGQWNLVIMPRMGWTETAVFSTINELAMLGIIMALIIVHFAVQVMWGYVDKQQLEFVDWQSGFYSRKGFESRITQWIKEKKSSFAIIYFVVDNFNQVSQTLTELEIKDYLNKVENGITGYVKNEFFIGRFGEGNFAVSVCDDMKEEAVLDLAKGLSLEMHIKTLIGGKKEFLNVGSQYVRYPQDGISGKELLDKVVSDFYRRMNQESPAISLTEKCRQLIAGNQDVVFEEYFDTHMMRLSKTLNQYRKMVEQQVYQDGVFHVGNRSKYLRDINMMISYKSKRMFALYCVDISSFGSYNEMYSVAIGDKILMEIRRRLSSLFGEYLYRINGDVFLGVMPGEDTTKDITEKIHTMMCQPVRIDSDEIQLDYHCGICYYPNHGKTPEILLEYVQEAVQRAKELNHVNTFVFNETALFSLPATQQGGEGDCRKVDK